MKAVILAGGIGSRISEESVVRPKPMVEIGGRPILWHIMKIFSAQGVNDFVICLGYKGYMIKEYFANYFLHMSDVTLDLTTNSMKVHQNAAEPWKVTLIDTGEQSQTGGRLKRVAQYVGAETFCMTYGDGLANVDISRLVECHRREGVLATVTAVRPPGRFGALELEGSRVSEFTEKPLGDGGWINGGYFVLAPKVFDYIEGDHTLWENEPLKRLATERQLAAYLHEGFWQPMDTVRHKQILEDLWAGGDPPWKLWT
jgi:glucose-1-phosphate cytidylyltransferase